MLIIITLLFSCRQQIENVNDQEEYFPDTTEVVQDTATTTNTVSTTQTDTGITPSEANCDQKIGSTPCNFEWFDEDDSSWILYQHKGPVLVLDFSTSWCSACQSAARTVQNIQDTYESQGFYWITILLEDTDYNIPDSQDIIDWKDAFGLTTATVLRGDKSIIDYDAEEGWPITGWPTMVVIDNDMTIYTGVIGWSEDYMATAIEGALAN